MRPQGTAVCSRAVALALAAMLTGAPQAIASAHEPEHRCRCPAGEHRCSCARCAAKAARAAASARQDSPPCHGAATRAVPAKAPEAPHPPPDAPCVAPSCHDRGAGDPAADQDPFVLERHPVQAAIGRAEELGRPALLAAHATPAPEPPPPRA